MFTPDNTCPVLLWILPACLGFRVRVFHALWMAFPGPFRYPSQMPYGSPKPHGMNPMVWALPRSLAATDGIIVIFSSSGYLDVSVRRVPSARLWIHRTVTCSARRVSPFRHPRIIAYVQLPAAFRSLSRLSSAPSARASALCPTMLNLLSRNAPGISGASLISISARAFHPFRIPRSNGSLPRPTGESVCHGS